MRRTGFVYAGVRSQTTTLVALALAIALAAPAAAQPAEGAASRVCDGAFHPEAGAVLAPLAAERRLGEPVAVDPALLAALGQVHTDPGAIPQLEVTVDGRKQALPLEHTDVRASVSGFVARVEVTQRYRNPLTEPIEAIYVFPLPENSAVDDMKIRVGDRLIEAEIQRRAEARATYEAAKRDGYTAALLEQERPNVFTQSVANIPPGEEIDVVVRYVQDLTYDAGTYEFVFPMVVGPRFVPGAPDPSAPSGHGWSPDTDEVPDASRITPPVVGGGHRSGHDIAVEVVIEPGLPVVDFDVPTHAVDAAVADGATIVTLSPKDSLPNRDFVLRFRVDKPLPQGAVYAHRDGDHGGFFTLVLQPPTIDVDEVVGRREIVFVIDISGSMWGRPIAMAKDAAREAIRRLRPVDTFNVVTFAGHTARAFAAPRPANDGNVKQAFRFIESAKAGGGTYLANAVKEVLDPAVDGERDRIVVFLTDGYVGNEKRIVGDVQRFVRAHRKAGHRARAFGFGIGSSANRYLIGGVGEAGDGAAVYLTTREDPVAAVGTMGRLIDHPILTDVRIDWGDLAVADLEPAQLPDLLASRPLVLHGRYTKAAAGTIVVTGRAEGKRIELEVPVVFPDEEPRGAVLETLWARARIESLSRRLWSGDDPEVIETITALGLDYRLVTPYTSFVAVDRSRKVGDGDPTTIVQPVDTPEGVVAELAAPSAGIVGGVASGSGYGVGMGSGKARPMVRRARVISRGAGALGVRGQGVGGGGSGRGVLSLVTKGGEVGQDAGGGDIAAETTVAPSPDAPAAAPREEDRAERPKPTHLRGAVRLALGEVEGALAAAIVNRVVRLRQNALKACYERELQKKTDLAGTLEISWTVRPDGRVVSVRVVRDGLESEKVAACVTRQVWRWRFPAAAEETTATLSVGFRPK